MKKGLNLNTGPFMIKVFSGNFKALTRQIFIRLLQIVYQILVYIIVTYSPTTKYICNILELSY